MRDLSSAREHIRRAFEAASQADWPAARAACAAAELPGLRDSPGDWALLAVARSSARNAAPRDDEERTLEADALAGAPALLAAGRWQDAVLVWHFVARAALADRNLELARSHTSVCIGAAVAGGVSWRAVPLMLRLARLEIESGDARAAGGLAETALRWHAGFLETGPLLYGRQFIVAEAEKVLRAAHARLA